MPDIPDIYPFFEKHVSDFINKQIVVVVHNAMFKTKGIVLNRKKSFV